nr:PREDICTED: uncharacterized protein C3orf67 homolog isoform X3 [Lepisosteus oculatus]
MRDSAGIEEHFCFLKCGKAMLPSMFKNEYQGGPVVDIFSAQGKDPMAKWKVFGSQAAIWKEFDKEVKSFVYVLEGSSQTNKMQMPKDSKMALGLTQRYLILQMYVPLGNDFTTELMITDLGNLKRRLYLSTVHKEVSATPLHAKIPLSCLKRSIWCNVCIDLVSFTSEIFKGAAFLSLDGIIISATCRLRKIFTMKLQPQGLLDDEDMCISISGPTDIIPRICQLPADVQHVTQLINMNTLRMAEMKLIGCSLSSETEQASSTRTASARNNKNQDISHIAFGSKVLGPPPATGRRIITTGSRETAYSSGPRITRTSHQSRHNSGDWTDRNTDWCEIPGATDSEILHHRSQEDDKSTQHTPVPHHVIQPHLPQDQSRERASRGRLQAQSAGKEQSKWPNATESSFVSTKSTSQVPVHSQPHRSRVQHQLDCGDTEGSNEDEETEPQLCQVGIFTYSSRPHSAQKHRRSQSTPVKNFPFILDEKGDNNLGHRGARLEDDFLGSSSEEYPSEGNERERCIYSEVKDEVHSRFIVQDPHLRSKSSTLLSLISNENCEPCAQRISYSPHSTEGESLKTRPAKKSMTLEDRSHLPKSSRGNMHTNTIPAQSLSPTGSRNGHILAANTIIRGISEDQLRTSLSRKSLKEISQDDSRLNAEKVEYDLRNLQPTRMSSWECHMLASLWRQQNKELEEEGRSPGLSASQIDNCNVSISTSSDDTTTWNSCQPLPVNQGHHYQKEMNPLLHSNPRDWLNVFSPPIIPPSQQMRDQDDSLIKRDISKGNEMRAIEDNDEDEVLTLLYDPCLNCYFDPETGKYYELA